MFNYNKLSSSFFVKFLICFVSICAILGIIIIVCCCIDRNNQEHFAVLKTKSYYSNNKCEKFDKADTTYNNINDKTDNDKNKLHDENTFLKSYIDNTI